MIDGSVEKNQPLSLNGIEEVQQKWLSLSPYFLREERVVFLVVTVTDFNSPPGICVFEWTSEK